MAYQLTVEEKPGFVHFRVTGDNTPETIRGYLGEVYAVCVERQCARVLIEEDLAGPGLDLFEIFQIVSRGSDRGFPFPIRIAYVDLNPAHRHADMQFAETVAVNRGLNIRVFQDSRDAQAWIEGQTDEAEA